MKMKQLFKKVVALVLVMMMIAPMMGDLEISTKEVQAAESEENVVKDKEIGYVIVPNASVDTTGSQPSVAAGYESDKYADYLFGGWFSDADAMTAAPSDAEKLYARFVPADVLSTKCQVTTGLVTDTSIDQYRNRYVLRFVSSIDSLDYRHVGFEISYKDGEETVTKTNKTNTVFERIESTTGSTADGKDTYSFSPKVMSTKSEYFITAKWPVMDTSEDKAKDYTVKAFWMTMDGTKVYGESRTVCVDDGLKTTDSINLTVANTGNVSVALKDELTVSEDANLSATVIGFDSSTVQVRISGINKATMKSATRFTLTKDGATVGSEIYRNLYTKYDGTTGTVDKSWYETNTSASEFIIATSADLYGLASILNANTYAFGNNIIYLVSDIKVNDEVLITEPSDSNYRKWYSVKTGTYLDKPTYADWIPAGRSGKMFNGTFDGQMHTISGIYCADNQQYTGLFGKAYTTATIKNLKLNNSYFSSNKTIMGGVVARSYSAKFNTVYCDALIETSSYWVGGFVGYAETVTMDKCWFDGRVINSSVSTSSAGGGTAGLLGTLYSGTATLTECLNTGVIDASGNEFRPKSAGLIGEVHATKAVLTDCLNTGTIIGVNAATIVGSVNSGGTLTCDTTYGYGTSKVVNYCSKANFTVIYDCYAGTGSSVRDNSNCASVPVVSLKDRTSKDPYGTGATSELGGFDFDETWTVVPNGTPVLQLFESEIIDTSWYDENEDTYVLTDKADLWGFSALSKETNFAGKTIKLGNDIVVNTGDASTWGTSAPKHTWTPASSTTLPFAGTFDGQMYTISGIYLNNSGEDNGLFSATASTSVIRNLYLKDSYFSGGYDTGSIVGECEGTLDSVYSNAYVNGTAQRLGGLVGLAKGKGTVLRYCWFDGNLTNTAKMTGGLLGYINANAVVTIESCLNSGEISGCSDSVTQTGGLVGTVNAGVTLTINRSLNSGNVLGTDSYRAGLVGCMVGGTVYSKFSYIYPNENNTNKSVGWMQGGAKLYVSYEYDGSVTYDRADYTRDENAAGLVATTYRGSLANDKFTGNDAKSNLVSLDFTNGTWQTVDGSTPILNFSSDIESMDKRWYDPYVSEYVLYDKGDLYGFAALSVTNNFAGKTVKLGNDIVLHEGDAAKWGTNPFLNESDMWTPISYTASNTNPFAGTFDGQGYTIRGLYLNTTQRYAGLFACVGADGVVKNVKLTNSYLASTGRDLGSIAGRGDGKFYMVHSDAIVKGTYAMGGMIGLTYGGELENCWFKGSITNTSTGSSDLNTGGIVGFAYGGATAKTLTLRNCLNTANIDASSGTKSLPFVGGLIGLILPNSTLTVEIDSCLNTGTISKNAAATGGVGAVVGYCNTDSNAAVIYRTYAIESTSGNNIVRDSLFVVDAESIKGTSAETNMPYLEWGKYWKCGNEGQFPELIFTPDGYSTGVDATQDEQELLAELYAERILYQGELHAHAQTLGKGDDGKTPLKTWVDDQISGNSLAFAASLDHHQYSQFTDSALGWEKSKLIYGTEAGTTITNRKDQSLNGELHYNMLFPSNVGLETIINQFPEYTDLSQMNYLEKLEYNLSGYQFRYPDFTRERFIELIEAVKANNGFFVHAHPTQTSYAAATSLDDYYFAPNVGFEVIYMNTPQLEKEIAGTDDKWTAEQEAHYQEYGAYVTTESKTHYSVWNQLLNAKKRLYATAGSDTHSNLNQYAVTSVYSHEERTNSDKGEIINQLRDGDFVAGAVGIQMSVQTSETQIHMGGEADFNGNRLVVNIGDFHDSVVREEHKYRVDIYDNHGLVVRKMITPGQEMNLALTTTTNSGYYRVEVYDMTLGCPIAIGNPIWNQDWK